MRIIYAGSGDFAEPALRCLINTPHQVVLVVTQPDRPAGRGLKLVPTPVRRTADEHGRPVLATDNVNAADARDRIAAANADVAVVAAFGQKIGRELLDAIPGGWINIHASLLPAYRGASPIHRAILDRADETGVTVFRLVERMDAGPILLQRRTGIKPEETTEELHDRLAAIGCDAIKAALDLYVGRPHEETFAIPEGTPQDESQATYARKLRKEDGRIDFTRSAEVEAAHVNGMWPWPGAACRFVSAATGKTELVTLARARAAEAAMPSVGTLARGPSPEGGLHHPSPQRGEGRVRGKSSPGPTLPQPLPGREGSSGTSSQPGSPPPPGQIDDRLYVATAQGFLELLEIKPHNSRVMPWPDYVNGRHVQPGDSLANIR